MDLKFFLEDLFAVPAISSSTNRSKRAFASPSAARSSMPRDPRIYIEDILEAIRRIGTYTENMDFVAFAKSSLTIDAVVRNLESSAKRRAGSPKISRPVLPDRMA